METKKNIYEQHVNKSDENIIKIKDSKKFLHMIPHSKNLCCKMLEIMIYDDIISRVEKLSQIGCYEYECDLKKYHIDEKKYDEIFEKIKELFMCENYIVNKNSQIIIITWF
jgi:hypothetical protein